MFSLRAPIAHAICGRHHEHHRREGDHRVNRLGERAGFGLMLDIHGALKQLNRRDRCNGLEQLLLEA